MVRREDINDSSLGLADTCACPACLANAPHGGRIRRCLICGHRWMWTSATEQKQIEDAVYTHDYAGYRSDPVFEQGIRTLLDSSIVPRLPQGARVLDVGCGSGDFLAAATERGFQPTGIDISEAGAELCRQRGFEAFSGDFLTADVGTEYDAVTMWDVIEHLRDPGAFFQRSRDLLRTGGLFVGKVPAFGPISVGLSNHVPRLASMLLGAPDHVQYFSQESLGALLRRTGFDVDWLNPPANRLRGKRRGGSVKRRVGRSLAGAIKGVSGDGNLYFVASPA